MKTLTVVTPRGIHDYAYHGVTRLRQVVGASELIEKAMQGLVDNHGAWSGGGNAFLVSLNRQAAVAAVEEWSRKQIFDAPGLRFTACHCDCPGLEVDAFLDAMATKLDLADNRGAVGSPLGRLAVNARCPATGGVASQFHDRLGWASAEAVRKEAQSNESEPEGDEADYFPQEIEDLGFRENASQITVVHIDGNSIGQFLKEFFGRLRGRCSDAKFRQLWRQVSEWIENSARAATKALQDKIRELRVSIWPDPTRRPEIWKLRPSWMPMREVVWKGDERTFLFPGFLGLSAAVFWMEKFVEKSAALRPDIEGLPASLTASAGVAIVPQKFPFSRAFALAEELTLAAKAARKKDGSEGCWIDFEIVREGTSGRLAEMRKGRHHSECGAFEVGKSWNEFDRRWEEVRSYPRNRMKRLFETLPRGTKAIGELLSEYKARSVVLQDSATPGDYFRPLDALDHYMKVDWETAKVLVRPGGEDE